MVECGPSSAGVAEFNKSVVEKNYFSFLGPKNKKYRKSVLDFEGHLQQ